MNYRNEIRLKLDKIIYNQNILLNNISRSKNIMKSNYKGRKFWINITKNSVEIIIKWKLINLILNIADTATPGIDYIVFDVAGEHKLYIYIQIKFLFFDFDLGVHVI